MAEEASNEQIVNLGGSGRRLRLLYRIDPGFDRPSECFSIRFSPDDKYIAGCFSNGSIHVWHARTGQEKFVLAGERGKDSMNPLAAPLPTLQLRWKPKGEDYTQSGLVTTVNAEGQIRHWDANHTGECVSVVTETENPLYCIDYTFDGTDFATAGKDRIIRIYDEKTRKLKGQCSGGDGRESLGCGLGHTNRIFCLKYHPEETNILLTGGWDKTVQVWDTRVGHAVRSIRECDINGDALDFSQDGGTLLAGSWRTANALQIIDFGTGEVIENVNWGAPTVDENCMVLAANFSRDPTSTMIVAGGSLVNEAKFFVRGGETAAAFGALTDLPKPVFTTDFSNNTRFAAVGGGDGSIRVLEVN